MQQSTADDKLILKSNKVKDIDNVRVDSRIYSNIFLDILNTSRKIYLILNLPESYIDWKILLV